MSYKVKMEKLSRIVSTNITNKDVVEKLKPSEIFFIDGIEEKDLCLYPNEANFQIPNVFLKTKTSGELKSFVKLHNKTTNYTSQLDCLLDVSDTFDFNLREKINNKEDIKEEVVKYLVNSRRGAT